MLILAVILAAAGIIGILVIIQKGRTTQSADLLKFASTFQKDLLELRQTLNSQLMDISKQMNDQQASNVRFLMDSHKGYVESVEKVQHQLGGLQQTAQSMMALGKDIASLQDILKAPKLRGGIGELFLTEILKQILPEEYFELQYGFADGSKVDAVIRMGDGIIPVDAKFPLENFKRILASSPEDEKNVRKLFLSDVKKHIDSIADKYIKPQEGTYDFALMYIPAENVYYEIILKHDAQSESLTEYARKKQVVPVSPNSFYAYLQAIARGLKGLRIERSALNILQSLGQLETDFKKLTTELEKLGSHLSHAQTAYDKTVKGFDKIQGRLSSLEGRTIDEESVPKIESAENHGR